MFRTRVADLEDEVESLKNEIVYLKTRQDTTAILLTKQEEKMRALLEYFDIEFVELPARKVVQRKQTKE